MAWLPISQTVPQYVDLNGDPAVGYVLKFYAAGTTTNINLVTDNTGATQLTDVVLNSRGYPENAGAVIIPHLDQPYKIAFYATQAAADSDTGAIWTIDNISPAAALAEKLLDSMTDLMYVGVDRELQTISSFHPDLNKGGGSFYYDSTEDRANHNGITIIDPTNTADLVTWDAAAQTTWFAAGTGSGCWMRIYNASINVLWAGSKGDGATNDSTAIQKCIDFAFNSGEGGAVYLPINDYLITADVTIPRGVKVYGDGWGSIITGTGGGVVLNNTLVNSNNYVILQGLRIKRTDSGVGLDLQGAADDGISRWNFADLFIIRTGGKNGIGFRMEGAWNVTIIGVHVSGWDTGVQINKEDAGNEGSAVNGLVWTGGQIEGNNTGLDINGGLSQTYDSVVMESNTTLNADIDSAINISFNNIYTESNGNSDLRIGNSASCSGVSVNGGYYNTPSSGGLANSINAVDCSGLSVIGAHFARFTAEPVLITGSGVTGVIENCTKDSANTIGMVDVATNSADRVFYENADISLKETELTIASGVITITTGTHTVDTESNAASDDLDTINGGTKGMRLSIVAANSARTVNLTNAGNIDVPAAGIALNNGVSTIADLLYSEVAGKWILLSFQDNT